MEHERRQHVEENLEAGTWSVVLAGGNGERTRPFIERWLGRPRAKQYCTFVGTRSMLQHTVDRADILTSPERRVTVVARPHLAEAKRHFRDRVRGHLLAQPVNRGTAAGVFLALSRIQAIDPEASVIVYPSDHFVHPESVFLEAVAHAVRTANELDGRLVLLGVSPDSSETDYGWLCPGTRLPGLGGSEGSARTVETFVEKPSPDTGRALHASGGLWNTLIMAGRLTVFWELARRTVPELMPPFAALVDVAGTSREQSMMERIYRSLPERDFSRDVLERSADRLAVLPMDGAAWSDWGRPDRILESLDRLGKTPAFPIELAIPKCGVPASAVVGF